MSKNAEKGIRGREEGTKRQLGPFLMEIFPVTEHLPYGCIWDQIQGDYSAREGLECADFVLAAVLESGLFFIAHLNYFCV